jgi:hypothetical protein
MSFCCALNKRYDNSELSIAPTPIPISISRPPAKELPRDSAYISAAIATPAITAAADTAAPLNLRTKMQNTAATLAPVETPITSGLAN